LYSWIYFKEKNICGSTQIFRLYGAAYGEITNALNKLKKSKLYTYQIEYSYTSDAIVTFVFSKNTENSFIEEIKSEFYTELFEYIYADEDISLADKVVALLTVRKKKLGIAESFTGGMVASSIVAVSGASEIFDEGYVTYSNNAKVKELNVSEKTLKEHGAVSDETAYEMAVGLLHKGNDYVIATTGIAGPGGGSSNKPVGLCYVAVGSNDGIHVHRKIYSGSRNEVREQATLDALYKLIKIIR
jgi:competence/damage-inducible protein CinA C-terminal domain